jgi:outer membrane lipoprotein-sorting protein
MASTKLKFALVVAQSILVACGAALLAVSCRQAADVLLPGEIFKRAQEKYASLTSYSDEGKSVGHFNGATITTSFAIRLARPNFYRIKWEQSTESTAGATKNKPQEVWSAGQGDFLDMLGNGGQKQASQELALAGATGISGGAAATIPGTFFNMNWGDQLGGLAANRKQLAGEKVGDVDCYVFTRELNGAVNTLWIGKQDFLIHQVRTVTSAEAVKANMEEAAKRNPAMILPPQKFESITATETHTNIVLNQTFRRRILGRDSAGACGPPRHPPGRAGNPLPALFSRHERPWHGGAGGDVEGGGLQTGGARGQGQRAGLLAGLHEDLGQAVEDAALPRGGNRFFEDGQRDAFVEAARALVVLD